MSVVIPTRGRATLLQETLGEVLRQASETRDVAEVIVARDDDTCETGAVLQRVNSPKLRVVRSPAPGPAAARNAGVRAALGEVILFVDDDVLPWPGTLRGHCEHHLADVGGNLAVVGFVTWHPRGTITPFMYWLEHGGPQFAYFEISQTGLSPYHCYTANLSVSRSALLATGLFDERFREAAFEDLELGFRMAGAGVRFAYRADLGAYHLAQVACTRDYCEGRIQKLGRWLPLFHRCVPQAEAEFIEGLRHTVFADGPPPGPLAEATARLLEQAKRYEPQRWPPLAERLVRVYERLCLLHLLAGYASPAGEGMGATNGREDVRSGWRP